MSAPRSQLWSTLGLAAGVIVTLIVATVVYRRIIDSPVAGGKPTPPMPPDNNYGASNDRAMLFSVAAVEGEVELQSGSKRYIARAGDLVAMEDLIHTPAGGRAILKRGQIEIELRENVDVRLEKVAEQTSFDVLRGRIVATVSAPQENLRVSSGGTTTTSQGVTRFVVLRDDHGSVSVAAEEGELQFAARGKSVRVRAGTTSRADPDRAPTTPETIPEDLLLSVVWPEAVSPRDGDGTTVSVSGKTAPNTHVRVNGVEVTIGDNGKFDAPLPLRVGDNPVKIEAEDVWGHKKRVVGVVKRAPAAPKLETTQEELWQK